MSSLLEEFGELNVLDDELDSEAENDQLPPPGGPNAVEPPYTPYTLRKPKWFRQKMAQITPGQVKKEEVT